MESTKGAALPQLSGQPVVTDGGLETDLIFHHGVDLPDFASFPLVDEDGAETSCGGTTATTSPSRSGRGCAPAGDADLASQQRLGRAARLLRR